MLNLRYTNYQRDIVHLGAINVLNPTDVLDNLINDKGYIKTNEFFNFISNDYKISNDMRSETDFNGAYSINKQDLIRNREIEKQSFNSNRTTEEKDDGGVSNKNETNFNTTKESGSIEDGINDRNAIDTNLIVASTYGYANYDIKGKKDETKIKKINKKRRDRQKHTETDKSTKLSMFSKAE